MVSFDYLIHDAMGLHARPVGLVVKAVKPYQDSQITITHNGRHHHRLRTGRGRAKDRRSDSRYF